MHLLMIIYVLSSTRFPVRRPFPALLSSRQFVSAPALGFLTEVKKVTAVDVELPEPGPKLSPPARGQLAAALYIP